MLCPLLDVRRSAIVNEDLWFPNDSAMVDYLNQYFRDDPLKIIFSLTSKIQQNCINKQEEFTKLKTVKSSTVFHSTNMVSV